MIWNFEYLIVFTSAPSILPEQNDQYWMQPWKVKKARQIVYIPWQMSLGNLKNRIDYIDNQRDNVDSYVGRLGSQTACLDNQTHCVNKSLVNQTKKSNQYDLETKIIVQIHGLFTPDLIFVIKRSIPPPPQKRWVTSFPPTKKRR